MELAPGDTLGRYQLVEALGHGGMGSVWIAEQEGLGRRVALKVMHPAIAQSAELAARFKREAKIAASFNHPGIVPVTDFGVDRGRPFLVMDLLDGEPMNALLAREGPLEARRAAFIAVQMLAALEVAHKAGIVHRDLKPDNVFITHASGVRDLARLLDFGIARVDEGDQRMTATGQVLGTPAYMAPEQAKGARASIESDIYSVGVILYESVSGRLPHEGENYNQLLFAIVGEDPAPLPSVAQVPDAFSAVVQRAMTKDPSKRFASAREMREALAPIAGLEEGAPRPTPSTAPIAMAPTLASDPNAASIHDTEPAGSEAAPTPRSPGAEQSTKRSPLPLLAAVLLGAAALGVAYWKGSTSQEEALVAEVPAPSPERSANEAGSPEERTSEAVPPEGSASEAAPPSPEEPASEEPEPETAGLGTAGHRDAASTEDDEPAENGGRTAGEEGEPSEAENTVRATRPNRMGAVSMMERQRASMREPARPARVQAPCGAHGYLSDVYLAGPRTEIRVSSGAQRDITESTTILRRTVQAEGRRILRCFGREPIPIGQDVSFHVGAGGTVSNVVVRRYCPIPPRVERCLVDVFESIDFTPVQIGEGDARISFSAAN